MRRTTSPATLTSTASSVVPGADGHARINGAPQPHLRQLEATIARIRAEQIACLASHLDKRSPAEMAPQDVAEWLDVSLDTAATLLELATSLPDQPVLFAALAHGDITMDRARAIARLEHPSLPSFADAAWCYRVAELDELPTDP